MAAYIVSGKRSATGRFNGSLGSLSSVELGSIVIKELIESSSIDANDVDEVIMGNVLQAGLGQNPARQVAVSPGWTLSTSLRAAAKLSGSPLFARQASYSLITGIPFRMAQLDMGTVTSRSTASPMFSRDKPFKPSPLFHLIAQSHCGRGFEHETGSVYST